MRIFFKQHELNYFNLGYWRSSACAHNYSMGVQCLSLSISKIFWASSHIFWNLKGYCLNLQGKVYPIWDNLQTPWVQLFWFGLLEGYCSCPIILNSHVLPLFKHPIKLLGYITYLLEFGRVLHSPNKT